MAKYQVEYEITHYDLTVVDANDEDTAVEIVKAENWMEQDFQLVDVRELDE